MELGERLEKIKSRAYWRVNIRPMEFKKDRIETLSKTRKIIEECIIKLAGWNYPQFYEPEIINGEDWVQSGIDFEDFVEFWKFYQSGQFIHYFALHEDHNPRVKEHRIHHRGRFPNVFQSKKEPKGFVSIFWALYTITHVYEFAIRLAQKNIYDSKALISIQLHSIKGYELFFWERILNRQYLAEIDQIILDSELGIEELIATGHDEAIKKTIHFLECFNWNNPPKEILIEEQKKLLEKRL